MDDSSAIAHISTRHPHQSSLKPCNFLGVRIIPNVPGINMKFERDTIVKLTIGSGCVLGSLAFPPLAAAEGMVWGNILATALGNVAAGNTANAVDALIDAREGRVSLENQDLTKAVGKAILYETLRERRRYHPRSQTTGRQNPRISRKNRRPSEG
ncbi:hypothetical protein H4N54_00640 [Limnospira fusiformis KN01]|uniref:hypothetical protein n=1 Tax=Limnospira TaxID=2596745 RepID=UPI001658C0F1|nr:MULTISPECIES: hypothetical protein [Limnospira]MDT9198439.1 hypothetical protein [Limnospira sp. PMC 1042.18]ULB45948.1 hypothetical protein H4N54_00640 [Limnospira fusiformis KN01]